MTELPSHLHIPPPMIRSSPLTFLLLLALMASFPLLGYTQDETASEKTQRKQAEFDGQVRPFLEKYCFDCHSGDATEGELQIDILRDAGEIAARERKTWKKVHDRLFGHAMPPQDSEQPSKEERERIVQWLKVAIDDYDCSGPVDPGRETIRRLTRYEYKNTIRDLLGVEAELADDFPMDDVGYGFDNIGDVLTLSPLLMEKYLAAAEAIAAQVVVTNPLDATGRAKIRAADMRGDGYEQDDGWRFLTTTGNFRGRLRVPAAGEYIVRTRAYATQAGDELAKMRVEIDDESREFDVEVEDRNAPEDHDFRLTFDKAEEVEVRVAFLNDYYEPRNPNPRRRDRNLAVKFVELVGPLGENGLQYPEPHRQLFIITPGGDVSDAEAARRILKRLVSLAFRRPATDSEVERLIRLVEIGKKRGGSFEHGIQLAVTAVLASPHFLFKVEQDPLSDDEDGIRTLNDFELATRLSYFLWSSMPDEELFDLAEAGKLRQELEPQVRRMLADPKSDALVENFAVQWLHLRNLEQMEPDRRLFRGWNDRLRDDMLAETKLFFRAIVREDRSVMELINADFTFLNERLAQHYDIEGIRGDEFQRVDIGATDRGGVLTMGSVLTVTSNPTRTSPVKRGKWIMENILGTPPPDPPADVPELEETSKVNPNLSLRDQLAIHRENASCATCHTHMDALGLALENFDGVGAWRERDGRAKIDASGELPGGEAFRGPSELKRALLSAQKEQYLNCLTEKMLTYALGRGVEYFDRCTVAAIVDSLEEDRHRFSRLVLAIAQSEPFQKRRAKN